MINFSFISSNFFSFFPHFGPPGGQLEVWLRHCSVVSSSLQQESCLLHCSQIEILGSWSVSQKKYNFLYLKCRVLGIFPLCFGVGGGERKKKTNLILNKTAGCFPNIKKKKKKKSTRVSHWRQHNFLFLYGTSQIWWSFSMQPPNWASKPCIWQLCPEDFFRFIWYDRQSNTVELISAGNAIIKLTRLSAPPLGSYQLCVGNERCCLVDTDTLVPPGLREKFWERKFIEKLLRGVFCVQYNNVIVSFVPLAEVAIDTTARKWGSVRCVCEMLQGNV